MMLETFAPLALGILSAALFYAAFNYRQSGILGRFEFFYGMGNLLLLGMLFMIFYGLQKEGSAFASVVFPFFQAMMWIYFLICLVLVFRLIQNILAAIGRKKLGEFLGF
jgi:hypothetical protein